MGTQITYYTNNANIYMTTVAFSLSGQGQITQSRDYNTYPGQEHKITFADSDKVTSVTFTATPYSSSHLVKYEFVKWVYRVGSISASPQETTDNPFTFNEKNADGSLKSIWIRAEGKSTEIGGGGGDEGGDEGEGSWTLVEHNGVIIDRNTIYDYVTGDEITYFDDYPDFSEELQLHRYPIKYVHTSKSCIFTEGNADTIGYISMSRSWNSTYGEPASIIATDDDSGDGYNFFLNPILNGDETYYLYIRTANGESETSETGLYISYDIQFPDKWDWNKSDMYEKAKNAIDNRGPTTDFEVLVWNEMVARVRDIINFTGGSWDETYAPYTDTRMKKFDPYNILTATRFNSLRHNIGSRRVSTGIEEQKAGGIVWGYYFNILADCINSWIDIIINESG